MTRTGGSTAVHVAPHPDDEALGAPGMLLQLLDAGWRVVNVVVTLGSDRAHHERRRAEAEAAASRGGWEVRIVEVVEVVDALADVADLDPDVWISPSPHDGHPTHERVARQLRDRLESDGRPTRWSMWGGWAALPMPTLYVPYGDDVMARALHVVDAYEGELARNDYRRLLTARATADAILGAERVFGFGSPTASPAPYADLLTEAVFDGHTWTLGPATVWRPGSLDEPTAEDIGWWLHAPSVREQRQSRRPPS